MDIPSRNTGDKDAARPRAGLWQQLWRIDVGVAGLALAGAGIALTIFPTPPWWAKVGIAAGVIVFWCWSMFGLARDKAQLERDLEASKNPMRKHELRAAQLRREVEIRLRDLKKADVTVADAQAALTFGQSIQPDDHPEKMAAQARIKRATDSFDNARDMFKRADQTLQEHIARGPDDPDRRDVVKADLSGNASESTVD